jgi:excisionase family DNA binding protein
VRRTLSPRKAAKRFGCDRDVIVRALVAGLLPGTRNGRGRWRIDPRILDGWARPWAH